MSQKKERDAVDAALKRLIGDDKFRPQGIFGTRKSTPLNGNASCAV
jgi:hypothetical protein